jgi:hypothetical protein
LCVLRFTLVFLLGACSFIDPTLDPPPTPQPAPTYTPLPDDTGWLERGGGIETREWAIVFKGRSDRLFVARVDPGVVSFRVRYDQTNPRRVRDWLPAEGARLVVNAGYFDREYHALGLLIADGRMFGESYAGFGGLFGVSGGRVQVRSLILHPYQPGEVFEQMAQSFPMLLVGEGVINPEVPTGDDPAPRTVAGLDRSGRVVFLVSPRPTFTLLDLATWLAQSDLDLDSALNLDGGTSSGLIVQTPDGVWGMSSWAAVPAVIVVP